MQPEMTIHTLLKITGKSKSDLKYQNMFTTQSIYTNITSSYNITSNTTSYNKTYYLTALCKP